MLRLSFCSVRFFTYEKLVHLVTNSSREQLAKLCYIKCFRDNSTESFEKLSLYDRFQKFHFCCNISCNI